MCMLFKMIYFLLGTSLPRGLKGNFAGQGALGFETITMSPIQKKMIDVALLTDEEVQILCSN